MPYVRIPFAAGVYKDDSPLDAEGYFTSTDKGRFVRGKFQTIGGYEYASTTSLTGVARGLMTWANNSREPFAAIGTHLRLYAMDVDGNVTDITPVISRGELSNPFDTTNTDETVTVNHTAHGLVDDQAVTFPGQTSVNGADISGGPYAITKIDADSYTIEADSAATSTGSGVGGTVDYEYRLAPGQLDGLGGLGYGTGGFGTGGYGSSSSGYTLYPRTWSLVNWGQNLIAAPRGGGGVYEWAPNVTATELVSNGDFSAATGWSAGSGWGFSAGFYSATTASTDLAQAVTFSQGAWHLVEFDLTRSAGTLQPKWGTTSIGSAISASGTYKRTFFVGPGGSQDLRFTGSGFTGTIDNVSVKVLTTAEAITNAPTAVTGVFVTPERILVAVGCADTNGNFDALRVRWTDQENNQTWTATPSNLAGSYTLAVGSRIVRGMVGRGECLIWTDSSLYAMRYTGDPASVYRFDLLGTGCGLIGPNAVAELNGRFVWLSPGGEFFAYDGGVPTPLKSTIRRDVSDNLAWVQQDKVYAAANAAWDEVWFLYPDSRDGNECSRYVIYNLSENTWANGTFDRTSWCDASVFQYPLAVSSGGRIYFQEKGDSDNGAARTWSFETAYFDLGDGDRHVVINGAYPDADDLQGGYSMYLDMLSRDARGIQTRTLGPYNITNTTGKISVRATGQQARVRFAGNDAPAFFRMGAFKLDMKPSGRAR